MLLVALVAGAVAWFTLGGTVMRDRKQWPKFALALIGLILIAKGHPLLGSALVAGIAFWLRRPWLRAPRQAPSTTDALRARAEASDLLGISSDADREAILAAHRRLIARNHPDSGGTSGLAARLNAARDTLLKEHS